MGSRAPLLLSPLASQDRPLRDLRFQLPAPVARARFGNSVPETRAVGSGIAWTAQDRASRHNTGGADQRPERGSEDAGRWVCFALRTASSPASQPRAGETHLRRELDSAALRCTNVRRGRSAKVFILLLRLRSYAACHAWKLGVPRRCSRGRLERRTAPILGRARPARLTARPIKPHDQSAQRIHDSASWPGPH